MSYKYIPQLNNQNFIYPNNDLPEYDINIVHDINDNSVSGTVTNFSATTVASTGFTFTHDWSWSKNNAEPFISNSGNIHLLSVHSQCVKSLCSFMTELYLLDLSLQSTQQFSTFHWY